MPAIVDRFVKKLSATDASESATHQGGLLIPHGAARAQNSVFPALDPLRLNPETRLTVLSGTDGSSHELRYIYYNSKLHGTGTRNEYRLLWMAPLLSTLGGASAGDTFTLELDDRGSLVAHVLKPSTAWLLIASGDDRQYAGNEGYADEPDAFYSWDSTVPRHADLQVGDRVVVWDKKELIGFSVIEAIESEPGTKVLRRCPNCAKSRIKLRRTVSPAFKCQECSAEFEEPETEVKSITVYRSRHDAAWVDAQGVLIGRELRAICDAPGSQHSIRALRWRAFVAALSARGFSADAASDVDERASSAHGGHRSVRTRVRTGQGRFRQTTLRRYGEVCAFTGRTPAAALDAAHLYSYAAVGSHLDRGGLMVRKDIHRLFDNGDLAINPEGLTIDVRGPVDGYPLYGQLHGRPLEITLRGKQIEWIREHWAQHRPD